MVAHGGRGGTAHTHINIGTRGGVSGIWPLSFINSKLNYNKVHVKGRWKMKEHYWHITNIKLYVGFEVLKAVITKMAVFWVIAPCSLVEVYQRFRGPCWLHHSPGDGGSTDLWNVGKLLPDCTALQPRRQPSSWNYIFIRENILRC
jgi:hypothetical protein